MRRSTIIIPLAGLMVVGGILVGCGDSTSTTSPKATVTVTPAATPVATVAATAAPVASPVASQRIELLQAELKEAGLYTGPIDGLYHAETHAAIMAAQEKAGITVDGVYGPETHAALIRLIAGEDPASASPSPAAKAVPSEHIKQVQKELRQLGYYKHAVDGLYGPQTTAAIVAFQKDNGLTADGKLGPKTDAVLATALNDFAN